MPNDSPSSVTDTRTPTKVSKRRKNPYSRVTRVTGIKGMSG